MTSAHAAVRRFAHQRKVRALALGAFALAASILAQPIAPASAADLTGVDLSTYVRVGRYDLPDATRMAAPAGSLLAQEASSVTYDWDTDTLFVVGDGGTSVVQVGKTGQLIDSMTLASGGSPQGTEFYDTEGITYIGNGQFVMTEERDRQIVRFTYAPGTTLTRAATKTVKLGTTIKNIGLEGVSNDPTTGGFLLVKEKEPESIFSTTVDWNAGTASNGSATTDESNNLFDPALVGTSDLSDVYALSNVPTLAGTPDASHLLIISQESAKVLNISRSGVISSTLNLVGDSDNSLSIQDQTDEGVTLGPDGTLYVVNEQGGGADHPQMWVFKPSLVSNTAPTDVTLTHQMSSIAENTDLTSRFKIADVSVTDDGLGTNNLSVTGPDAASFEVDSTGLYLKAGTTLNRTTKGSYSVNVAVDDPSLGASPDATSAAFTLTIAPPAAAASVKVTEVSPWSSTDSTYKADWFELTNTGSTTVDLAGWKMDDNSVSFGAAVALNGVPSLAPGQSAVFLQGDSDDSANFKTAWFGTNPPDGLTMGYFADSGTGLSTGGDDVVIFNAAGDIVTGVSFGSSSAPSTFDNAAGIGGTSSPLPAISTLSTVGTNGGFTSSDSSAIGSPGTIGTSTTPPAPSVKVTEVNPTGSSSSYGADWFELTNTGSSTVDLTGWKMDDDSNSAASGDTLTGVSSLAAGQSAIFLEGASSTVALFKTAWFGSSVPAGLAVGTYSGGSVGLSSGGDNVNIFDAGGNRVTGVAFGAASTGISFDNKAGLGSSGATAPPTISTLSVAGTNGAFVSPGTGETGSPGTLVNAPVVAPVKITEVSPTGSDASYKADWFELTNTGSAAVDLTGWKMDDGSNGLATAVAMTGVSSLAPGRSAIFLESKTTDSAAVTTLTSAFKAAWFGGSVPTDLAVGTYSGDAVGLSAGGDGVNVFDASGNRVTGVAFGAATPGVSFDNQAGIGSSLSVAPPTISTQSVAGTNGAFTSATGGEVGSPGTLVNAPVVAPVKITEVSPTGSDASYKADWFELTNTGSAAVDLTGWKMDDGSNGLATAVAMTGVSSLAPGRSAIFLESKTTDSAAVTTLTSAFKAAWFGGSVPTDLAVGTYSGDAVGLSAGGDGVNVFDASGNRVTGVAFGAATPGVSFDNQAGIGSSLSVAPPTISTQSVAGTNGAFTSATGGEVGSPGTLVNAPVVAPVKITEVNPTGNATTTYKADWFELTNTGTSVVDLTGWKMDDSSNALATAAPLTGVSSLAPGQSAVFIEGDATTVGAFKAAWFGPNAPSSLAVGSYTGSGVSLSNDGDGVNVFDAAGNRVTGVAFGAATTGVSFDNQAGIGSSLTVAPPTISTLSIAGVNGAYVAGGETGSPDTIAPDVTKPTITFTGNAGTYTTDQAIQITCTATDEARGSGIASTTCASVSGLGSDYGLGDHTITATATDKARNVGTGTVSFTVVAPASTGGGGSGGGGGGGTTTTPPTSTSDASSTPPAGGTTPPITTPPATLPPSTPNRPSTSSSPSTTTTKPKPKVTAPNAAKAKALSKGVPTTLTGLKAKSKVVATVRVGKKTLKTIKVTVDAKGRAHVTLKLSAKQLAKLHGKTLTVRFTVTGADGKHHTLTKTVKVG